MGKIRRRFDKHLKIQICEAVSDGKLEFSEACHQHQISRDMLEGWMRRYSNGGFQRTPDRTSQLERENQKLLAKVGELTLVVDFLKKTQLSQRLHKSERTPIITSANLAQFQGPARPSNSVHQATTTKSKKPK